MDVKKKPIIKSEKAQPKKRSASQAALNPRDPTQVEYFGDIVGTIREPLVVLDKDLRVLAANRSFYKFFKVKQKETLGTMLYDLGNRQWDIHALRTLMETILPQKVVINNYEVEHDFPVIGRRTLLLNARRIPAPPKEAQWILLAFEDITERIRLERILQDSELRFRGAFETATDSMLLVDKTSGRVLNSNWAAQNTFSRSNQQLLKMNLWELDLLIDHQQFEQISEELEKKGAVEILNKTIHTGKGGQLPADIYLMDRTGVIQCNIRDISDRREAEGSVRAMARFPAENPNPVLRIARDGNLRYANKAAFVQLADWKLELGKPAGKVLNDPIKEVFNTGTTKVIELTCGERIFSIAIGPTPMGEDLNLYGYDITKRKQAEQALAESENKFRWFYEYAPVAYHILTPEGTITDVNHRWCELLGYRREEVLGKVIFDFVVEQDRQAAKESFEKKKQSRQAFVEGSERNFRTKDGAVRIFKTFDFFATDERQNISSVQSTIEDITERKKAEQALAASELQLRTLFASMNDAVIVYDRDGRYVTIAPTNSANLYRPSGEMLGKTVHEILPREQADYIVSRIREAIQTGQVVSGEYSLQIEGKEVWFASSATRLSESTVQWVAHDITKRKRTEEALRSAKEFAEGIITTAQTIVLVLDTQGCIIQFNPYLEEIAGYTLAEVQGKDWFSTFIPERDRESFRKLFQKAISGIQTRGQVNAIVAKDGSECEIEWYDKTLKDSQGVITGLLSIGQNVTERKRQEAQILATQVELQGLLDEASQGRKDLLSVVEDQRRSEEALARANEQLRALTRYIQDAIEVERTQIARGIHDEFGQSMTALKMDLAWLAKRLPEGDERLRRIDGMNRLVDDSIVHMRQIATELRPNMLDELGLAAALEWQAKEFTRRTEIPCELELPAEELEPALRTSLFRIFQEALTNVARHAQATRVDASLRQAENALILSIQDNGVGIREAELNGPRSLGLIGLRERVLQWGGEMMIRGVPGKGTTVTVRIPLPASPVQGGER